MGSATGQGVASEDGSMQQAADVPSLLWPSASGPTALSQIESVPLAARGLPGSTYELLSRAARLWPDRPAISVMPDAEHWQTSENWTFAQLTADVECAARVFAAAGIGRGDAVALISVNCAQMVVAMLGAQAAGITSPINPALAAEHAVELVRLSGAKVIVAAGPELDRGAWALARECATQAGVRTLLALRPTGTGGADGDGERDDGPAPVLEPLTGVEVDYLGARMAADRGAGLPGPAPQADDIASYLHTGGTTGTPKLAAHTHTNEVTDAWMISCFGSLDGDDVMFGALPLFHTNALLITVLAPLFKGQQTVWAGPLGYRDPALAPNFWRIVEHFRITSMSAVPTVYQVLTQVPVDADLSSLKVPIVGAAPLPPAVRDRFKAHTGIALCEGYGLTEGTCASTLNRPTYPRLGTVGQRFPYQEAAAGRIDPVSGEWELLPAGTVGSLLLRGPNVFAGYLKRGPDGARLVPGGKTADGWLDSGDLAAVDGEGFVHLVGRTRDLIIRGGHNIDPKTIEDALLTHPEVTGAAAVGRPDQHAGEVPVAYVTVRAGAHLAGDELVQWAAGRVGERAAVPKSVEVIAEIPLTSVGKQFKPELRRRASEQAARRALADMAVGESVVAVLDDGVVTVEVGRSGEDEAVRERLDGYAWSWRFR